MENNKRYVLDHNHLYEIAQIVSNNEELQIISNFLKENNTKIIVEYKYECFDNTIVNRSKVNFQGIRFQTASDFVKYITQLYEKDKTEYEEYLENKEKYDNLQKKYGWTKSYIKLK